MMTKQENDLISQAKQALREGNRVKARLLAEQSTQLFPEDVEAWLILAGLSSFPTRQDYIHKAEILAPDDFRVQKAIQWASNAITTSDINQVTSKVEGDKVLSEAQPQKEFNTSQDSSSSICPYLGLEDDPKSSVAYPSNRNVCYQVKPVKSPKISHQSSYCLGQKYERCKLFNVLSDNKMPKDIRIRTRKASDHRKVILRAFLLGLSLTAFVWGIFYREEVIADFLRLIATFRSPLATTEMLQLQPIQPTFTLTWTHTPTSTWTATVSPQPTTTLTPQPTVTHTPRLPTSTSPPPTSTREKPVLALETPIGSNVQFIIHKVIPGESLEFYEKQYNTSVAAIRAVNYRLPSFLPLNWVVVIPLETEDVENFPTFEPFEVKEKINVEELSEQLDSNLDDLKLYNNLDASMYLTPGEWLLIPRESNQ